MFNDMYGTIRCEATLPEKRSLSTLTIIRMKFTRLVLPFIWCSLSRSYDLPTTGDMGTFSRAGNLIPD